MGWARRDACLFFGTGQQQNSVETERTEGVEYN